jgi:hypothetical protein
VTTNPFAREPVRITLARERVTLPYHPAADWIGAVCASTSTSGAILPLLTDTDRNRAIGQLARGTLTADQAADAFYDALRTAIPGHPDNPLPWWESYRLLVLSTDPAAAGRMLLAGLDPWEQPPAAWCYALYQLMTQGLDAKAVFRFDAELKTPPAGVDDDDWGDMSFDQMVSAARSTPGIG